MVCILNQIPAWIQTKRAFLPCHTQDQNIFSFFIHEVQLVLTIDCRNDKILPEKYVVLLESIRAWHCYPWKSIIMQNNSPSCPMKCLHLAFVNTVRKVIRLHLDILYSWSRPGLFAQIYMFLVRALTALCVLSSLYKISFRLHINMIISLWWSPKHDSLERYNFIDW